MTKQAPVLIQVGGNGKRVGKTSLICRLLEAFPGSAAVKSGTHHREPHAGDSMLFTRAGAVRSAYFPPHDDEALKRFITDECPDCAIVFIEKNRRIPGLIPDVYVFIDAPVAALRTDAADLRRNADIILKNASDVEALKKKITALLESK